MATTGRGEGRGETSGPAGTRADRGADGAAVETDDRPAAGGRAASDRASADAAASDRTTALPARLILTAPVVYKIRTRKRKKKKYSRGLKDTQRVEDGLSLASQRLGRAVERGLRSYRRRRNKSARRKKDGAIRDGLENVSIGFGRALRVASDAPYDVARKVNSKRFSRQLRDSIRFFTLPLFR